jgi:cobalt-zinc-cadmium efflux system outer membrane protein
MTRSLFLFALLLVPAATLAQAPAGEAALTLAELEQLALESNPTLQAAQAAIEAARGRARQAAAWPNPTVGYSAEEITVGDERPRGEHGFFVEQTIPLGGKLRLGREVFDRVADEAAAHGDLQGLRILSSVRTLFYEILTAERRIEVHERLAALGSEATGVTAQLFNVGAADRPDFLESEIEMRRVQLELTAARNDVFARRLQLAALVGREEIANRRLEGTIDAVLPDLEREMVTRALIEQSPQIRAARAAVARAQAVTARARRDTYPDLFLRGGAEYNREQDEGRGTPIGWQGVVEAGISIPLFNRNQGGIAAARAEETRAEAELRRVELSLRSRVAAEFATYLTALRAAESYRTDILPRAEQAYAMYLKRYREMAAAYPQVLVSQRTLFEMSREYVHQLDAAWRSALRLQGLLAGGGLQTPGGETDDGGDVLAMSREPRRH